MVLDYPHFRVRPWLRPYRCHQITVRHSARSFARAKQSYQEAQRYALLLTDSLWYFSVFLLLSLSFSLSSRATLVPLRHALTNVSLFSCLYGVGSRSSVLSGTPPKKSGGQRGRGIVFFLGKSKWVGKIPSLLAGRLH